MSQKQTPHIKPNGVEIAETILLPGDPLRAKFIAETYLEDAVCFNEVRGMLGYTGTYGALPPQVKLYDVILGLGSSTNSNYMHQYNIPGNFSLTASFDLLLKAYNKAQDMGQPVHVGNILCSEVFYNADEKAMENWIKMGVLAVEMESTALYANATAAGVNALTILTVSDSLVTGEETTPEERQTAFTKMMEIALDLA